jgi:hypothetical protein
VTIMGDEAQVQKGERASSSSPSWSARARPLRAPEIRAALRMLSDDAEADLKSVFSDAIAVPSRKKWIAPKTLGRSAMSTPSAPTTWCSPSVLPERASHSSRWRWPSPRS